MWILSQNSGELWFISCRLGGMYQKTTFVHSGSSKSNLKLGPRRLNSSTQNFASPKIWSIWASNPSFPCKIYENEKLFPFLFGLPFIVQPLLSTSTRTWGHQLVVHIGCAYLPCRIEPRKTYLAGKGMSLHQHERNYVMPIILQKIMCECLYLSSRGRRSQWCHPLTEMWSIAGGRIAICVDSMSRNLPWWIRDNRND